MSQELSFEVRTSASREETIECVCAALKVEGFDVLTRIEIDQTYRDKLGEHFRPYTILGACNPELVHAALTSMPEFGLLLPCSVTVEADIHGSLVRIANPAVTMQSEELGAHEILWSVTIDATQRLWRVAESLRHI